jgi:cytochrome c oxidase subunit IV
MYWIHLVGNSERILEQSRRKKTRPWKTEAAEADKEGISCVQMLEVLLYLRLFFDIAREVAAICSILIKRLTSSRSGLLPPCLLCTILHLMPRHCLHTFRLGFTTCYYAIRILDDMLLRLHEVQLLLDVVVVVVVVVLMSTEIHHLYNTCCRRRRRRIPELKGCNL